MAQSKFQESARAGTGKAKATAVMIPSAKPKSFFIVPSRENLLNLILRIDDAVVRLRVNEHIEQPLCQCDNSLTVKLLGEKFSNGISSD